MTWSAFARLPVELISIIYMDWLGMKDLARFDSALCTSSREMSFLRPLQDRCILHSIPVRKKIPLFMKWLVSRNICMSTMEVNYDRNSQDGGAPIADLYRDWFARSGRRVHTLTFDSCSWHALSEIATACGQLTCVFIYDCELNNSLFTLLRNNPLLSQLTIAMCKFVEPIIAIGELQCTDLTKLFLQGTLLRDEEVLAIVGAAPNLRALDICGVNLRKETFVSISELCPGIVHLSTDMREMDADMLDTFMGNFTCGLRTWSVQAPLGTSVSQAVLMKHHAHTMRHLHICMDHAEDIDSVVRLINSFPHLHTLEVESRWALFTGYELQIIENIAITEVACVDIPCFPLTAPIVRAMARVFPAAQVINLCCGMELSESADALGLAQVLSCCTKLHTVYLNDRYSEGASAMIKKMQPAVKIVYESFPGFDVLSFPID